jgi:ligand-binding SRPBCC domain-containing protein
MTFFEFNQFLPVSIEKAWEFFSTPVNLGRITPPEMNFIIRTALPDKVYPGLIIIYTVSPVAGIPVTWVTEITQLKEPFYFVDEQRSGPYRIWHHEHHFKPVEGGVMMTDRLFYQVPFGPLGKLADRLFVRKKVRGIFSYREGVLGGIGF